MNTIYLVIWQRRSSYVTTKYYEHFVTHPLREEGRTPVLLSPNIVCLMNMFRAAFTSRSMTIEHDVHTNVLLENTFCMFPQQEHVFDVYDSFTSCMRKLVYSDFFSEPYLEFIVAQSKQVMFCFLVQPTATHHVLAFERW